MKYEFLSPVRYFKYLNRYFFYKLCTYEISEIVSGYDAKPIEKLAID